jgi:hypothetical protein
VIEAAEGRDNDLTLGGGIGLVEAGEEPTAGIEIGCEIRWRLQSQSRVYPFEQARLEILEHRYLPRMLACCKLERTPHLLEAPDELVTIKGHRSPYCRSSQPPSTGKFSWPPGWLSPIQRTRTGGA